MTPAASTGTSGDTARTPGHPPDARPIHVVGAGAIVRDAHLPAYRLGGLAVAGFFDLDPRRARALAESWPGSRAFGSLVELLASAEAVHGALDVALPPEALAATLPELPAGIPTLVQKPFGRDLAEATRLLEVLRARRVPGAVNFQLRHAPVVAALRELIFAGAIGEPIDLEVRVVCRMPWETWAFLEGTPRMEVLMHSIHYLDLARSLFGEPTDVWASTSRHPAALRIADVRSTAILRFAGDRRAVVTTFHHHAAPPGHDASHLKVEGTRGTAVARLGVNLDYPRGRPDALEWSADGRPWRATPIAGNWFPHAFLGSMQALLAHAADPTRPLESSFGDAWRTMALVETCYRSAERGLRPPEPPHP